MKRTPLERRTPLRRRGWIRSAVISRSSPEAHCRAAVRAEVYERDSYLCLLRPRPDLLGPCFGGLTPHHLVKAWKGGDLYVASNLVTLCAGHNDRVEDEPLIAHGLGLVVWEGETVALAWDRLREIGLVA